MVPWRGGGQASRQPQMPEGRFSRVVAAHAMHAGAGRGGGGAEIDAGRAGGVGAQRGAQEELAEGERAAGDVAAEEVGVQGLKSGGRRDVTRQNAVAEAGGEALDLGLNARGHVLGRAVGDVAVGPEDVAAGRGAGGIEERGLRGEDERALGGAALGDGGFRGGDLFECAAEMDRGGAAAAGRAPGDGIGEGEVDFEGGGSAAEARVGMADAGREAVGGDGQELGGRGVKEGERGGAGGAARGLEGAEGFGVNAAPSVEMTAERLEMGDQGVGNGAGSAPGDGPTGSVTRGGEDQADGGAEGLGEVEKGVAGETGEQSAGAEPREMSAGEGSGGGERVEAEARHEERVARHGEGRRESRFEEGRPTMDDGREQMTPGWAVGAERVGGLGEVAFENHGGAIVEGMSERGGGVNPFEAVGGERERGEEGRGGGERMDGGAEVVEKAGQGEREGAGGAARLGLGFEDLDPQAGGSEDDGRGEAVGTGADNVRVVEQVSKSAFELHAGSAFPA
jgi:hypothetical protein